MARLLICAAVAFAPVAHSEAASGERLGSGSGSSPKADGESLQYDSFSGFNCSQNSFTVDAIARLNVVGPATIEGKTTLGGTPYDTYSADLGVGPDTFPTNFGRDFTGLGKPPPPASSTYEFVFESTVKVGSRSIGRSVTRIRCTNGALAASNNFLSDSSVPVPVGGPASLALLGLALGLAAVVRLRGSRA